MQNKIELILILKHKDGIGSVLLWKSYTYKERPSNCLFLANPLIISSAYTEGTRIEDIFKNLEFLYDSCTIETNLRKETQVPFSFVDKEEELSKIEELSEFDEIYLIEKLYGEFPSALLSKVDVNFGEDYWLNIEVYLKGSDKINQKTYAVYDGCFDRQPISTDMIEKVKSKIEE